MDRRRFITTTTAAASMAALSPMTGFSADPNAKIRLGVIGCGGRGAWITDLFKGHGGFEIVALADYFKDRVDGVAGKQGVPAEHCHTGLNCHRKMIAAGGLDAVAIISPPYFHPEQAAAAVDAGLHVYVAKPIAVDAPGCRSIGDSGRKAAGEKQVFLVDFQTRNDPFYTEALRRVHDGALGDLCFGESLYHASRLNPKDTEGLSPAATRMRNWVFDKALSGDIITEQNIHTLDVMNWIMRKPPLRVTGTGGRKVRVDVGDCWDHFACVFEYENDVGITFSSRQFNGHGTPGGIINRMFGSKGVLLTQYGGQVMIRGGSDVFYKGGKSPSIYLDGAVANIKSFHDRITQGVYDNPTVAPSVRSNLITIMARTAAYESRTVTWDEIVNSKVVLKADLSGLDA